VLVVQALLAAMEQTVVLLLLPALPLWAAAEAELNLLALMVAQAEEEEWQYLTLSTLVVREPQVKETTVVQVGVLEATETFKQVEAEVARVPLVETLLRVLEETVEQVRLIPTAVHLSLMQAEAEEANVRLPARLARVVQAEAVMVVKQMLAQLLALQTLGAVAAETE
jgi:hypothetical protein